MISSDSGAYESRITSLTDELTTLRAVLSEKESSLAKLRLEILETSERTQRSVAGVYFILIYVMIILKYNELFSNRITMLESGN